MSTDLVCTTRSFRQSDTGLIVHSFVKTVLNANSSIDESILIPRLEGRVFSWLREPERFRVVVDPEHDEQIFGWSYIEKPNLAYFVFVKQAFRRQGIARKLLEDLDTIKTVLCPFWSPYTQKIQVSHKNLKRIGW